MKTKKFYLALILAILFIFSGNMEAQRTRGTYKGGHGSSHKGGNYKNKSTRDHYRTHK